MEYSSNERIRELAIIAMDLLDKYEESEDAVIGEFCSGNILEEYARLSLEVSNYKKRIESLRWG